MPWSDYPTDVRQFSGLVRAAAEARFGAAATVQIMAAAARDAGIKLSFQSYSALSRMYGDFVGARNARDSFNAALQAADTHGSDQAITAGMIARMPWSPAARDVSLNPFALVTATFTVNTPEGPMTGHFSHRYASVDLHTVEQLRADLQLQLDQGVGQSPPEGAQLDQVVGIEWSTA